MPIYELSGMRVRTPASGRHWIAPTATVLGNVTLEEDTSIWFGAVIRGDNEAIHVGRRSNIQDNCVLHTDPGFPMTIGEGCTIGHLAMLHGCTVGRGTLVGIGAVVLNGAVIGEDCLIGAKALIPEGKVIPPRSLVLGSPGKVARQLSDADVAQLAEFVQVYVDRCREYAEKLRPQSA
jgi:carbonic anhydrase/acetyltransferase-like protein (isoleucine patch superfamily)